MALDPFWIRNPDPNLDPAPGSGSSKFRIFEKPGCQLAKGSGKPSLWLAKALASRGLWLLAEGITLEVNSRVY